MDFILTDKNRNNTAIMPYDSTLDIEIGGANDFAITIPNEFYDHNIFIQGGYLYKAGTEYGGILNEFTSDTAYEDFIYNGLTFRGMMMERYVEPPSGSDYLTVSGELNSVLATMFGSTFYGDLFRVSTVDSVVSISSVNVQRYADYITAANSVLSSVNYKVGLEAIEYIENGIVKFYIEVKAVPIVDYSDEIENSQDGMVDFKISKKNVMPYNYMLCLGSGELRNRIIVKLHIVSKDTIEEVNSIVDSDTTRIYFYDYSSAQSRDDLIASAKEKAKELIDEDSQKITISEDFIAFLGDYVGGRDYVTNTYIKEKITKIVYKYSEGDESFSYTIGGE